MRNNGLPPIDTEAFFHAIISVRYSEMISVADIIKGIKDGRPMIETAIAHPNAIHQAQLHVLKNNLADVFSFLAV